MPTLQTTGKPRDKRFAFGKNWLSFAATINEQSIMEAESSLREMLEARHLEGKRFLDIGCGSGLFSLAARRLGAFVHSFDYDPMSVSCASSLRDKHFDKDRGWTITQGSVLDRQFMTGLGKFDVVYAWGVLHHTGDMWSALEHATEAVVPGGQLLIAIYNDQGLVSRFWKRVKQLYCSSMVGKLAVLSVFIPYYATRTILSSAMHMRNLFAAYRNQRGMSIVHDWIDWVGGYPFQVASVPELEAFLRQRGLILVRTKLVRGSGNNELLLRREWQPPRSESEAK